MGGREWPYFDILHVVNTPTITTSLGGALLSADKQLAPYLFDFKIVFIAEK